MFYVSEETVVSAGGDLRARPGLTAPAYDLPPACPRALSDGPAWPRPVPCPRPCPAVGLFMNPLPLTGPDSRPTRRPTSLGRYLVLPAGAACLPLRLLRWDRPWLPGCGELWQQHRRWCTPTSSSFRVLRHRSPRGTRSPPRAVRGAAACAGLGAHTACD